MQKILFRCCCFFSVERAVYPFNKKYGGREKRGKNLPAKLVGVRFAKGPLGKPGSAVEFFGRRNSYVEIPKGSGALDTVKSITLMAWVQHKGKSGPIIHYIPNAWGVHLWMVGPKVAFVRFTTRKRRHFTKALASGRFFHLRGWNLVAATYNHADGTAKLFINHKFVSKRKIGKIELATNAAIRLGARRHDRRFFKGKIACVKVFAKALSSRSIAWAGKSCVRRKYISISFSKS